MVVWGGNERNNKEKDKGSKSNKNKMGDLQHMGGLIHLFCEVEPTPCLKAANLFPHFLDCNPTSFVAYVLMLIFTLFPSLKNLPSYIDLTYLLSLVGLVYVFEDYIC